MNISSLITERWVKKGAVCFLVISVIIFKLCLVPTFNVLFWPSSASVQWQLSLTCVSHILESLLRHTGNVCTGTPSNLAIHGQDFFFGTMIVRYLLQTGKKREKSKQQHIMLFWKKKSFSLVPTPLPLLNFILARSINLKLK